jgi:type I thyroxine 5'-deiodinase
LERLYKTYNDDAQFLLIYIREAHPDSVLFVEADGRKELIKVRQTETLLDRIETAQTCSASLHLSIPTLVDKTDNAVNAAYAGWPDRMAVVDLEGNIAYYGGKGPGGFKPNEVEKWLKAFRADRSKD